jgi:hypothetical protein
MWSISEAKTFRRCQRQWYYKYRFASAVATRNELKREAHVLGTLQTISAWRGHIVDKTIETFVVPTLNGNRDFWLRDLLAHARQLFERQLAFGLAHRVREKGMTKEKANGEFAAFLAVENGGPISDEEKKEAWADVQAALRNFFHRMGALRGDLKRARRRQSQPKIYFEIGEAKVKAIPDLVLFFDDEAPMIVDWKVHYFGVHESRFQLAGYALALVRSGMANSGRMPETTPWTETDIRLVEAQLLTCDARTYQLTDDEVLATENEILQSMLEMDYASDGKERDELDPAEFPRTENTNTCQGCGFYRLCWKETHANDRN